jgi:hypothetical protein
MTPHWNSHTTVLLKRSNQKARIEGARQCDHCRKKEEKEEAKEVRNHNRK